jgi:hypothetical protein
MRLRFPLAVLSFAFVSAFFAAGNQLTAGGQTTVGSVTGRVLNAPDGYVLPGAGVTLTGPDGRERRAVTDEQGRFQIGELPPGRYHLVAALPGFAATARHVEVGPPGAFEVVVDVAMDYACVEEDIRVYMPLEFAVRQSGLIAHVRILAEGALQPWPTRPACLYMAREYTASIQAAVYGNATGLPLFFLPILISDRQRFSPGTELLVFLNWSAAARRFVLTGTDAAAPVRSGRLTTDHATLEEINGLTVDEATQVIRHLGNLPATMPPQSIAFDNLTVPPDRRLSGCALTGQPWRGTDPGEVRRVFQRVFPPLPEDPLDPGPLPDWTAVTEAYSAKYRWTGGPDIDVLAVRFQDAEQAERWPLRLLTAVSAIQADTMIAGIIGEPSPCLPAVSAHLRSLSP